MVETQKVVVVGIVTFTLVVFPMLFFRFCNSAEGWAALAATTTTSTMQTMRTARARTITVFEDYDSEGCDDNHQGQGGDRSGGRGNGVAVARIAATMRVAATAQVAAMVGTEEGALLMHVRALDEAR